MDTSPEYVKMCEKAEEIQKLWKPIEGDLFYTALSVEKNTMPYISMAKDYENWNRRASEPR